jgi:hypothetical protein
MPPTRAAALYTIEAGIQFYEVLATHTQAGPKMDEHVNINKPQKI